jgi:hypothetical protein
MKKHILIVGCLLLTSACNIGVSAPEAESSPTQTPLPAPTTVSVTQGPAPTETVVPTPEPPPLYFTEEFDTASVYWEFLQAGGSAAPLSSFENGALRIRISSPDTWLVGIYNANSYANVFIRAKTAVDPTGSAGLICRYSEDGWYEFNASNDGAYSVLLGQWLSAGVAKYIPIINDNSKQLTGGLTSGIGFFCEDNFLQLYAGDVMIRRVEVTNYGLGEGKVGITASSFTEMPMSAVFEWLQVSRE